MKIAAKIAVISAVAVFAAAANATWRVGADCTYNGIRLQGNVEVVDQLEDIRVRVVDSLENLRVLPVEMSPTRCGEWRFVTNEVPDFRVKFVDSFWDVDIVMGDVFPGVL